MTENMKIKKKSPYYKDNSKCPEIQGKNKTTSMTVRTSPTPQSVTYSWLANAAFCDAQTFFSNSIGFCSFGQDPQVQWPIQLISNCYKTILQVKKKTYITIISNKIQKKKNYMKS